MSLAPGVIPRRRGIFTQEETQMKPKPTKPPMQKPKGKKGC